MSQENVVNRIAGLNGTEYSFLITTTNTNELDTLFGFNYIEKFVSTYSYILENTKPERKNIDEPELFLDIQNILRVSQSPVKGLLGKINIPISKEVTYNFYSARSLMVAYKETEKVVEYFFTLATKVGFFFALPYDEVIEAKNNIFKKDVEKAIEEGYLTIRETTKIDNTPIQILELTNKFCPLEKRLRN